jgi:opacity protein-like surface antigen
MKRLLSIMLLGASALVWSQEKTTYTEKGQLSLGLRTTTSVFGHDPVPGLGVGGQFRLQILDYINTEWFADYISMDLKGAGTRNNTHIGWSVMFYPKKLNRFVPYVIAGHCFDYAKVTPLSTPYDDRSNESISRWSSAVQAGLGTHFYLTDRFNMTFSAQYMMHLGNHLDYELEETALGWYLDTAPTTHTHDARLEGHILLTFSINYRLADFW